jgi:cytochrome c oxidase assembly protein subunit 11
MSAVPMPKWKLFVLVAGVPVLMGSLAFLVMPRLYSLWCSVTGTGMNPNNADVAAAADAPTGRFVEVFFESKIYDALPVRFWCEVPSVQVEVGREASNTYFLENTGKTTLHIRPIHQVSPISATPHFGMRICFCFNDQVLAPGERKEFPVVFNFSPELDERTSTVSVCYSLFSITPGAARSDEQLRIQGQVEGAGGVVSPGFKVMSESEIEAMRRQEQQEQSK